MERIRFDEILLVEKQFVEEIWSCLDSFRFFCINSLFLGIKLHYSFQFFGTALSCHLHNIRFLLYKPGQYIQ